MDGILLSKKVFLPKLIIVDENGNHIETTNRSKLPKLQKIKKTELLGYELFSENMPLTNPVDIVDELEERFRKSAYYS